MSKSVLISIQPYWVFLIIAKAMGWDTFREKTIEVRKSFPKDGSWNEVAKIYCSKDKKSFAKIPKEYQPFMKPLLGKVVGEFVCNAFGEYWFSEYDTDIEEYEDVQMSCLSAKEIIEYGDDKTLYFWNISDLKIYDEPKELRDFFTVDNEAVKRCEHRKRIYNNPDFTNGAMLPGSYFCKDKTDWCRKCKTKPITRPPQSWCYVEDMEVVK